MKKNMGPADRYSRFILGVAFILNIFALDPSRVGMFILLALGLLMFYTSYTAYCFLYDLLGVCTCSGPECECNKKEESSETAA